MSVIDGIDDLQVIPSLRELVLLLNHDLESVIDGVNESWGIPSLRVASF